MADGDVDPITGEAFSEMGRDGVDDISAKSEYICTLPRGTQCKDECSFSLEKKTQQLCPR